MSIFQSDCIKIVLSDQIPKVKSVSRDEGDDDAAAQPHTAPEYFIHRSLLSSLSLELYKHINNDMKEGRENVLELSEVDAGTLDNFLGWAYFKDYKLPGKLLVPDNPYHAKLYVLADRFNISALEDLAFSRITALLASIGMVSLRKDIVEVSAAIVYAYENFPLRAGVPITDTPVAPTERLLRYLTHFIAWALEIFKYNDRFMELLASCPDFTDALVGACSPALMPPWDDWRSDGTSVYILTPSMDKHHIFYRRCNNSKCGYTGVMAIVCESCADDDSLIGTIMTCNGKRLRCPRRRPHIRDQNKL